MIKCRHIQILVCDYRRRLGRRLYEERYQRGLKLHEVSKCLGIVVKHIERAELGFECSLQHIAFLADYYGKRLQIELVAKEVE